MSGEKLAANAGVGLKARHLDDVLTGEPDRLWFEVHPENYMGAGGPPHAHLTRVRERHQLSLHGVGLSIGGAGPLDREHLERLAALVRRYEPAQVSEHLAWSTHQGRFLNDLLALPYTDETLTLVADHVDQVQSRLGRRILIENPATYIRFAESTWDEVDFIAELARRTGCGLLLDVNNVYVACVNHDADPFDYLARFPTEAIDEIHLAGHAEDSADGRRLLIDAHDRAVCDAVWTLYRVALSRTGPKPTLIEWDNDVPDWPMLRAEAAKADAVLSEFAGSEVRHVA